MIGKEKKNSLNETIVLKCILFETILKITHAKMHFISFSHKNGAMGINFLRSHAGP